MPAATPTCSVPACSQRLNATLIELRRFLAEQMLVWDAVVRENNIKAEL